MTKSRPRLFCKFHDTPSHPKSYPSAKPCSNCKKVAYCSIQCQKRDWDAHVFDCKSPTISTAQYLLKAIRDRVLPTDPQTRVDWGFERAGGQRDILLALYIGLDIVYGMRNPNQTLRASQLRTWRETGTLIEQIKAAYDAKTTAYPDGLSHCVVGHIFVYAWFVRNTWVLDLSLPSAGSPKPFPKQMLDSFTAYSGKDLAVGSWTPQRVMCAALCGKALHGLQPYPGLLERGWVEFGFCVARTSAEEMKVLEAYTTLFLDLRCPFETFAQAYEKGELFTLLKTYCVAPDLPHFEKVVSQVARGHESVWRLKEGLTANSTLIAAVVIDYGFVNCQTDAERGLLADAYKAMMVSRGFDAMELHDACVEGKIWDYACSILKMLSEEERKSLKKLMKKQSFLSFSPRFTVQSVHLFLICFSTVVLYSRITIYVAVILIMILIGKYSN
ncbi:hypothetical protein CYLTODRAFT_378225 [Cylindrobasidium torrendii FP15055 ss-10]|uniref:MYND-type domain-containing protein n=1 Tax=Cylindrobasidium torrendii FP15055 ss-10 TaxID=1314674 RepID=A0A0D7B9B7_9AGAR|nr:hypothetical protein CYLTODRAFT_378225 [Cylindrobasidium torrendii FP15055 ss-10]